jgi:hypothetical protein
VNVDPAKPVGGRDRSGQGEAIQRAVEHAIGLYRSVLEGLGVDPFAGLAGHDTPRQ